MGKIVEMKIKPEEVMEDLEVQLHNGKDSPDEDYWYDRLNFINSHYEHYMDTYSSTDDEDKDVSTISTTDIYHNDGMSFYYCEDCTAEIDGRYL